MVGVDWETAVDSIITLGTVGMTSLPSEVANPQPDPIMNKTMAKTNGALFIEIVSFIINKMNS